MKMKIIISIMILLAPGDKNLEKIFMLTNYIMTDYENAVRDGKVISDFEYREMREFCSEINRLAPAEMKNLSNKLCKAIEKKENIEGIKKICTEILKIVIQKGAITPSVKPEIELGEKIYMNLCSRCHGEKGEGLKFAQGDLPPPAPLTAPHISPVKVYLTTKFGLEGTTMPAFEMNEKERWSLAFYVSQMGFKESGEDLSILDPFSLLFETANKTNEELVKEFGEKAGSIRKGVFKIKNIDIFKAGLKKAIEKINEGKFDEAGNILTKSYMIFEEVEPELKLKSLSDAKEIELLFRSSLSMIKERDENSVLKLQSMIEIAEKLEKDEGIGKNLAAFTVVLREGFEAIIIVASILAIVSLEAMSQIPIYIGAIGGIIAGVALWEITGKIISINREIMEGVFTVIAVLIIIWVSFWVLEKTREENIKRFMSRVKKAASGKRYFFLLFLSFLATSRESGEAVLFLRALGGGIEKGVILGFISLLAVAYSIYIMKVKLSVRKFFLATNIILNITAVALIGKAIVEFQEAGIIPISFVNIPKIDIIGVYPTLQSLIPQIALFIFLFGTTLIYTLRKPKSVRNKFKNQKSFSKTQNMFYGGRR